MDFNILNLMYQEREFTDCLRELSELESKRKRQIYRVANYLVILKNADLGNGNSLKNVSTHTEDHLKVLDELRETKGQLSHFHSLLDNANLEKKNLEKTFNVQKAILEAKVEMGLKTIKRLKEIKTSAHSQANNPFAQNSTPFATTPVLNKITIFKTAAEMNGRKIKSPARHTPLPKKSGSKIPLLSSQKLKVSPLKAPRSPRSQCASKIGRTLLATSTPDATNTKLYILNQTSPLRSLIIQNKDRQRNDITRTSIFDDDDDDDNEDEISDQSFERKAPLQGMVNNSILTNKQNRKKRKLFSARKGLKRFLADHDAEEENNEQLDEFGPGSPVLKKLRDKQILSPLKKKNQTARLNIFGG